MLTLQNLTKKYVIAVIITGFILGCLTAYGIEIVNGNSKQVSKQKTSIVYAPSVTLIPSITPVTSPTLLPTNIATPTLMPTPLPPTPTTMATLITPQIIQSASQSESEQLSLQLFDPNFLWADYLTVGPTEATITGTGFTSQTIVELFPTQLDPSDPISNEGTNYSLQSVTFISSHQLKGKLPSGLYNSYYGVRIKNPDGKQVESSNVLVVSGNTQKAGSFSYQEN